MNEVTSSGTGMFSLPAFLRRMASRVSRSGAWISVSSPHSNRERSRASSVWISLGGRSDEMIELPARFVQRVEGVEELFLGRLFAGEKLDIVD